MKFVNSLRSPQAWAGAGGGAGAGLIGQLAGRNSIELGAFLVAAQQLQPPWLVEGRRRSLSPAWCRPCASRQWNGWNRVVARLLRQAGAGVADADPPFVFIVLARADLDGAGLRVASIA